MAQLLFPFDRLRNYSILDKQFRVHYFIIQFAVIAQTTLTAGALLPDVYILTGFAANGAINRKKRQENLKSRLQS